MFHLLAEHAERHRPEHLSDGSIYLIVAAVCVVAILGRGITHAIDRNRIANYAASQGWELLSCNWKLLGPGWFGNTHERLYRTEYRDGEGRTHAAFAKTSMLAGVYLSEDQVRA
jgi:hypothetical protein